MSTTTLEMGMGHAPGDPRFAESDSSAPPPTSSAQQQSLILTRLSALPPKPWNNHALSTEELMLLEGILRDIALVGLPKKDAPSLFGYWDDNLTMIFGTPEHNYAQALTGMAHAVSGNYLSAIDSFSNIMPERHLADFLYELAKEPQIRPELAAVICQGLASSNMFEGDENFKNNINDMQILATECFLKAGMLSLAQNSIARVKKSSALHGDSQRNKRLDFKISTALGFSGKPKEVVCQELTEILKAAGFQATVDLKPIAESAPE